MRIKGLLFISVLALLVLAISWISISPMLESKIEHDASIANGALVEIDGFDLDIIDLKVRWDRLQVTNPENTMTNSFEVGEMELDFLFWPTLWERLIIEDVIFKDFKMDTERETDGYFEIPEVEKNKEPSFISQIVGDVTTQISNNAQMEFTNIKTDINVDSLLAKLDLQAPDKIDSLRNSLSKNYQKWDSTLANTSINTEIASIEKTINNINVSDIKDPKKAIEAIQNVQKLVKQADSLKNRAQDLRTNIQNDFESTTFNVGRIDNWIERDFANAMNMAKLPNIDPGNIAQSIFGPNILADYAGYLEYIALAREYSDRFIGGDDKEKIERYEGKDYKFTDKYEWPRLWIQNIDVSGETKTAIKLAGQISHISSNQKKTKEPITFNISGGDESNRSMTLTGEFNYLGDAPKETISYTYDGFNLQGTKISPSQLLPYPLEKGVGEVSATVNIIDKRFDAKVDYAAKDVAFNFGASSSDNRIQSLIKDAISGTDQINVSALVNNLNGPLNVKVRSNVDDLFVNTLKNTVNKELSAARNKIETRVQQEIGDRKEQLLAFKNEKEAEIRNEYQKIETRVTNEIQKIEEKKAELEKKKKELEKALKDKLLDKIGY